MSRCLTFLLLIILAIYLPGCGKSLDTAGPTFVVGLEGNPTNLDPRFSTDAYSVRIRPLLFDSLIEIAPDGTFAPGLAKSWDMGNGRVITFHLRKGVTFHDGKPLTSRDVKYTFTYLMDPVNKCPAASSLDAIESIETPDDYTIVFRINRVFIPILFKLVKGIVPEHLGNMTDFADNPVGSGPFMLDHFSRGEIISLKANTAYFKGAPKIPRVRFEVVRNDTTRLFRLQKGELNLVQNAIPPYAVKFIERNKNLRVLRAPGINYSYMGFNLHDPNKITSNLKVRQAIAHSINRKQIIEKLLKGQARLATGLLSPEHWGYNPDGPTYDLDLPKARALLDEAGFRDPDGDGPQMRFEISYKTSTNKLRNRIAEVVAAQLIEVGIGMEKRSYEWGTFYADVKKGNFQTYTLSWVGITDPDIFHYIFHSKSVPPQGANRGRFIRPKVDKLIDKTRYETNHEKRKKLFIEIQKEISEQCVYVSLWWADNIVVTDIALTGYSIRPGGEYTALATANWEPSQ